MADIEKHLLQVLDREGSIEDSESFASTSGYDHNAVVSSIKSLQSYGMIVAEVRGVYSHAGANSTFSLGSS